jgi:hypothetical protein
MMRGWAKNCKKELPMSVLNPLALRGALVAAAWIAVTGFALGTAQAQRGHAPWCADLGGLNGDEPECDYYTYEQCRARASGITNICSVNPYYVPQRKPVRRQRREPSRYR